MSFSSALRMWARATVMTGLATAASALNAEIAETANFACERTPDARSEQFECELDAYPGRPFTVYLPENPAAPRPPVVIAIHGGGGNSEHAIRTTCPTGDAGNPLCLHNLARAHGYLVVAPNGTSSRLLGRIRTWNAGGGEGDFRCTSGRACEEDIDDIAYFEMLLDELALIVDYDPLRVYATGISNGGAMTHRLACQMSGQIAAIFAVGGANQYATSEECLPERPVSIAHAHGTADPCWQYDGGAPDCRFVGQKGLRHVGVETTISEWVDTNGCASEPDVVTWPDVDADGNVTTVYRYPDCDADVVLMKESGTGHTWPNGDQYFRESLVGPVTRDWGNERIIEFFDAAAICRPTRLQAITPAMADAAGSNPVWMVDASFGVWQGPGTPVKTAWIVARDQSGDLRVTGRRLDGPGTARFADRLGEAPSDALIIQDARNVALIPGGADAETIRRYAFHSSAISYPSPGCWEMTASYGDSSTTIVVEVKSPDSREPVTGPTETFGS